MVKVLKSGLYTTVQDLGRFGYKDYGVPVSGAMDSYSANLANALLGNVDTAAVLEITLIGPKLKFLTNTTICITGANISPRLNESPVQLDHSINIKSGDILSFGKVIYGCRSYLAVSGGFQTTKVMTSRSFYPNITSKSRVEVDDILPILSTDNIRDRKHAVVKSNAKLFSEQKLKIYRGPEFDKLSDDLISRLLSETFKVSKENNRMGYQLENNLENNLPSILTSPVLSGTVQLTPSGRLIVLMKDGQTTGGYPRILQLNEEAINVLAQKRTGDFIQFILI